MPVPFTQRVLTLDERAERIMYVLEVSATQIGEELIAAKHDHPGKFMEWVDYALPFGIDKAERLMAIQRAMQTVDPDMRDSLPPAWTAMYELSRLNPKVLADLVATGEVTRDMTVAEARRVAKPDSEVHRPDVVLQDVKAHQADLLAWELTRTDRTLLSTDRATELQEWLETK